MKIKLNKDLFSKFVWQMSFRIKFDKFRRLVINFNFVLSLGDRKTGLLWIN